MKTLPLSNSILLFMFAFLLSAFAPTPKAHAELLGTWTTTQSIFSGGVPLLLLDTTYWFGFGQEGPTLPNLNLFEDVTLDNTMIGASWTATQFNDPDFGAVVDILTNDAFDAVGLTMVFSFGVETITWNESIFDPTPPAIDFAGSTIDSFTLTLDDFALTQQGAFNVSTFTFTFSVLGTVPGAGILAPFALGGLMSRRRRHRRE